MLLELNARFLKPEIFCKPFLGNLKASPNGFKKIPLIVLKASVATQRCSENLGEKAVSKVVAATLGSDRPDDAKRIVIIAL